jgi:hypothetical protein
MPNIDYTNTVIYRIGCGGKTIYGHTTNLQKLKSTIKSDCARGKKTKMTTFIMENGGYEKCEWYMLEQFTNCKNNLDANLRVEYYKSIENDVARKMSKKSKPRNDTTTDATTVTPYECPTCKKIFARKFNMERHLNSNCKTNAMTSDIQTFLVQITGGGDNFLRNIETAIQDMVEKMQNDSIRYTIYSFTPLKN